MNLLRRLEPSQPPVLARRPDRPADGATLARVLDVHEMQRP